MLPKKSKHFIQPTASELDVDADLVDDAVTFFYKHLRRSLKNMLHPNIKVASLGYFRIKEREVPKLIYKYDNHLAILKSDNFNQMQIKKRIEHKKEKALRLKEMIDAEEQRKEEFIKFRKDFIKKRDEKNKSNME